MRRLRLQDTRTGQITDLEPRDGEVGIYACGPTVYNRIHIGNARPFVVFSRLKRFLEHEGLRANLVVNVTDINDKIYVAARERGVPSADLGAATPRPPSPTPAPPAPGRPPREPLASESIEGIVDLIQT